LHRAIVGCRPQPPCSVPARFSAPAARSALVTAQRQTLVTAQRCCQGPGPANLVGWTAERCGRRPAPPFRAETAGLTVQSAASAVSSTAQRCGSPTVPSRQRR
jgi:hypothetical protein